MADRTHMKKEAVKRRPTESITTDRVGYHASGTGLVMGFGALNRKPKASKALEFQINSETKKKRN